MTVIKNNYKLQSSKQLEIMKNISKEDFILWDTVNNEPLEHPDTVYHYTTVVEIINTDRFKLSARQELRCVAELSKGWQTIISEAIERTK